MILHMIRTYSELCVMSSFKERFNYLRLDGIVGKDTFGFDRYINQKFYTSPEWRTVRNHVIARDNGCDLAMPGEEIYGKIYIHHMNPLTKQDLIDRSDYLLNPEYLICVSHDTHNAIHYGEDTILDTHKIVERRSGDTCPWREFRQI